MRESLETKYEEGTISDIEKNKYSISYLVKYSIFAGLFLFMIIYSFCNVRRSVIFFSVLGGGKFFSFYTVALWIFYITLYLVFAFSCCMLGYIIYCKIKKLDYLPIVHKYSVKLDLVAFICKCLSIILFIMVYISSPCTVIGASMEPTFLNGDKLMCSDLFYEPKADDVVIFDAANYTHSESFYIKRIVAVEGDKVNYDQETGVVTINDVEFSDIDTSGFNKMKDSIKAYGNTFTVPENKCIVLGDNRENSYDSRKFGLIDNDDIFGKVYFRLFPLNKIRFY